MKRYFDATIDGHKRIEVVEADNEDDFDIHGLEKPIEYTFEELPEDFDQWKRYGAYAVENAAVDVLSRDGD